jgi:hypothetical protein
MPAPSRELPDSGQRKLHLPRSRTRRFLFVGIYLLFCGGLIWGGAKLFWRLRSGVPVTESPTVWDYFYPELRKSGVWAASVSNQDDVFDVLLLGGSALETNRGSIEAELTEGLRKELGPKHVRVFNLAKVAHSSRDSLFKHAVLKDKAFDLVIAYDGFNDVRMNSFPRDKFRDDYTHCSWYRSIAERVAAGKVNLAQAVKSEWDLSMGLGAVEPIHFDEGRDIKTTGPFRGNLEGLLNDAKSRGETLLLMTVAWHIPADYTLQKFGDKTIDYSFLSNGHSCPVEMWGRADLVGPAVRAHNAVLRQFAAEHHEVLFVDQESGIHGGRENFVDPCHFTAAGCKAFVANVLHRLHPKLAEFRAQRNSAS